MPYEKLSALIQEQIRLGVRIKNLQILSEEDLSKARGRRQTFDEYSETLLRTSFSNSYVWAQFERRIAQSEPTDDLSIDLFGINVPLPLEKRVELFHESMGNRIDALRSVLFQLGLYYRKSVTGGAPEIPRGVPMQEGLVFVAMHMDKNKPELDDTLSAIKRVAKQLGLDARRIDDEQSNKPITARTLQHITRAQYIVVDLTHDRPSVYFEAGYATALGNDPIYVAKEGTLPHFDVHDNPIIFFRSITDLETKLSERLRALVNRK